MHYREDIRRIMPINSPSLLRHGIWTILLVVLLLPGTLLALNIDSTNKYAWGENIGWINFGTTEGDVDVSSTAIDGYAWGENVGWISLTCNNTSSCATVDYGITRSGNVLSGYAWGENVGWISFACENTSSCGTVDYGVEVETTTGDFSGYAWGENIGWIVFNCSTTSSCGTVSYKVATTDTSHPGVPPIVLPSTSSSPSATPTVSPSASPTSTPTVTPTRSPTVTPTITVTPTTTPTATPPIATPTTSPSPTTSPIQTPVTPPTEVIGRILDNIAGTIFGLMERIINALTDACGESAIQASACGVTAISTLMAIIGFLAMLLQQEIAAAVFSMLQAVGLKKRARVWGTVYDSRTKRPIAMAKTELIDASGRVLETRYADRDGRYGFLLSPSMLHAGEQVTISIRVAKPGFTFPSNLLVSGTDYFVYDNVYKGGPITVRSDSALTYNIPMDASEGFRMRFGDFGRSLTGPLIDRILNLGFYAGIVLVPLNLYLMPSTKNLIILIVFFVANLFRVLTHFRPYGKTVDAATGRPMAFALITLNKPGAGRVAFTVSDEFGRYILSAEKGQDYDLIAHTPANVSPQRETRERVHLKSGWMTRTIMVGKDPVSQTPSTPPPAPPPTTPVTPSSPVPSGVILSVFFALFAVGIATGRPRLPIGAVAEGIDESYAVMHPNVAAISDVLRQNENIITLLALITTATVAAGAVIAAREMFMNWIHGRRNGGVPLQTVGIVAFGIGAIVVPLAFLSDPNSNRMMLGIIFLAASAIWTRAKRTHQR